MQDEDLANGVPGVRRRRFNRAARVIEPDQCVQFDEDGNLRFGFEAAIQPAMVGPWSKSAPENGSVLRGRRLIPTGKKSIALHPYIFVSFRLMFDLRCLMRPLRALPTLSKRGVGMWHEACLQDSEVHMEFKR